MTSEFTPNWKLDIAGKIAVALTISLNKHIPGWPGATDEQLAAVAADILAVSDLSQTVRPIDLPPEPPVSVLELTANAERDVRKACFGELLDSLDPVDQAMVKGFHDGF